MTDLVYKQPWRTLTAGLHVTEKITGFPMQGNRPGEEEQQLNSRNLNWELCVAFLLGHSARFAVRFWCLGSRRRFALH